MNFTQSSSGLLIPESPPAPPENTGAGSEVYDKAHSCCPECGSTRHEETTMGFLGGTDRNRSQCLDCDWLGIVDDRVLEDAWHATEQMPWFTAGLVWIRRTDGRVVDAYFIDGKFQVTETVGDSEGLSVEYYYDVTHWAVAVPKEFPSVSGQEKGLLGIPMVVDNSLKTPRDLTFIPLKEWEKGKILAAIKDLPVDERTELYETGVLLGKFTADDVRLNEGWPELSEGSQ